MAVLHIHRELVPVSDGITPNEPRPMSAGKSAFILLKNLLEHRLHTLHTMYLVFLWGHCRDPVALRHKIMCVTVWVCVVGWVFSSK